MTLPNTTNKQQEIITLIPQFRFLDRTHIQSFLHHKDKKRINNWLKDLTEKRYLKRIYDNQIIGKNRRSAIFSLDNNGVRFIKTLGIYDGTFIHKLYFDKTRSDTFIEHCLLIATMCTEFDKKNNDVFHYEYTTESDMCNSDNPFYFLKTIAVPVDLVSSKKEKGRKKKHFMLTLFDETLPRYRIRKRIRDYYDFYFSNEWENNVDTPFPTLLFIFQTKERMIYAKRYTKTLMEEEKIDDLSINFAIAEDVLESGVTGEVWE